MFEQVKDYKSACLESINLLLTKNIYQKWKAKTKTGLFMP